jgi:hypothetical protein
MHPGNTTTSYFSGTTLALFGFQKIEGYLNKEGMRIVKERKTSHVHLSE